MCAMQGMIETSQINAVEDLDNAFGKRHLFQVIHSSLLYIQARMFTAPVLDRSRTRTRLRTRLRTPLYVAVFARRQPRCPGILFDLPRPPVFDMPVHVLNTRHSSVPRPPSMNLGRVD